MKYNDLELVENIITWQGEGLYTGIICAMLRFKKCNLKCPFCFGIKEGEDIPTLEKTDGTKIKINKVNLGDKIYTFNANQELVETEITISMQRNVTEYYEIKINEKIYCVTPEHPFFTTRGLIEAQNLKIGDSIVNNEDFDRIVKNIKYINTKETNEKPLTVYNISCSPYNTYLIDNMWVHNCDTQTRTSDIIAKRYKFKELMDFAEKCNYNYIITGGEPTLYNEQISDFISYITKRTNLHKFTIETNGFKLYELHKLLKEKNSDMSNIVYHFSPKYFDSDNGIKSTMKIIEQLQDSNLVLKIVAYDSESNYKWTRKLVSLIRKNYKHLLVFLMPESQVATEVLLRMPDLLPIAKEYGCNISSRLHLIHDFY